MSALPIIEIIEIGNISDLYDADPNNSSNYVSNVAFELMSTLSIVLTNVALIKVAPKKSLLS